jgi:hypothetical protein
MIMDHLLLLQKMPEVLTSPCAGQTHKTFIEEGKMPAPDQDAKGDEEGDEEKGKDDKPSPDQDSKGEEEQGEGEKPALDQVGKGDKQEEDGRKHEHDGEEEA